MLERITLRNFQKHRSIEVEFARLTTFVGPSDAGKSAVSYRAIRWALLNKPLGMSFIRKGSKAATVSVVVDGASVERKRSASSNTYALDAEQFKAFGNDVPRPIAELANVDALNFQGQHDPPFWFTLSPGQLSKELNRIVNLELIDEALKQLTSMEVKARTRVGVTEERLEEARTQLRASKWAVRADRELRAIETISREISQTERRRARILDVVESMRALERSGERKSRVLQRVQTDFTKLEAARDNWEGEKRRLTELRNVLRTIAEKEDGLWQRRKRLRNESRKLSEMMAVLEICPLCGSTLTT